MTRPPQDELDFDPKATAISSNPESKCKTTADPDTETVSNQTKQDIYKIIQNQRIQLIEKDHDISRISNEMKILKEAKKELGLANLKINELEEKRSKIMKSKEQLGNTIQSLKQEKETTENQLTVLQKTVASQKSTLELNTQLINDLQIKVASHKDLAFKFMDEVYDKDQNNGNEADVDNTNPNHNNAELLKEIKSLEDEINELKNELQQAKQTVKDLQEDNNQKLSESQAKDQEVESLKNGQKEQNLKKNNEINGLKGMVTKLEAKNASDYEKNNSLQAELESTKLGKETHRLEVESLQKKLADAWAELSSSNMLVDKLKSEATEPEVWDAMKNNLKDKDILISEMKENENFLNGTVIDLKKEIESYTKQLQVEKGIGRNQLTEITELKQALAVSSEHSKNLLVLNNELKQQKFSKRLSHSNCEIETPKPKEKIDQDQDMNNPSQMTTIHELREAVHNNKVCIREINEHSSCRPRSAKGCPFSHQIPEELDNGTRNSLMIVWSEKHKKCAYEFVKRGSCKDPENCTHCIHKKERIEAKSITNNQPKYCFSELRLEGSCQRGKDSCRFEHDIPEDLRKDKAAQTAYIHQKEDKRAKCVNEYRSEGSCR